MKEQHTNFKASCQFSIKSHRYVRGYLIFCIPTNYNLNQLLTLTEVKGCFPLWLFRDLWVEKTHLSDEEKWGRLSGHCWTEGGVRTQWQRGSEIQGGKGGERQGEQLMMDCECRRRKEILTILMCLKLSRLVRTTHKPPGKKKKNGNKRSVFDFWGLKYQE